MAVSVEQKKGAFNLSKKGADLIKKFEACVLHPYLDDASVATIGWGTTHYESGKPVSMRDKPITAERAEQLFQFEAQAKSYVLSQALHKYNVIINQNQYDACVSISYNIGIEGFLGSTLFRLIKANPQDPKIIDAFNMWNKVTVNGKKVVNNGLKARRAKEASYYFS